MLSSAKLRARYSILEHICTVPSWTRAVIRAQHARKEWPGYRVRIGKTDSGSYEVVVIQ